MRICLILHLKLFQYALELLAFSKICQIEVLSTGSELSRFSHNATTTQRVEDQAK